MSKRHTMGVSKWLPSTKDKITFKITLRPSTPQNLLKLAHQSISDITSFALLRGATKTINAVGYTFAKLSIKRGHIRVGIVCSITHKTFLSKFCICVASWLVEKRYSKDVVCVRIPHHPFPTLWVYLRIAPCSFYHLRPIHVSSSSNPNAKPCDVHFDRIFFKLFVHSKMCFLLKNTG